MNLSQLLAQTPPDKFADIPSDVYQDAYRTSWIKLANAEGHKPRLPNTIVPPAPKWHPRPTFRQKLVAHFQKNPSPMTVPEISKMFQITVHQVRRVCRDMVAAEELTEITRTKGRSFTLPRQPVFLSQRGDQAPCQEVSAH